MKVVIIAAGMGSRLWAKTDRTPKTLLPYGNGTILSKIIANFSSIGLRDFVIVIGYRADIIRNYIADFKDEPVKFELIENPEWERGNGLSVLAAESKLDRQPFILSMSDHIVSPEALRRLASADNGRNSLLVDSNIQAVFDIDDATKILSENFRIIDIGKDLNTYNGIDCGVFKLTNRYFSSMKQAIVNNRESISDAIKILINNNDMDAVLTQSGDRWVDIDTPEAYQYSLKHPIT